jgi:PAS domain S-box-containing protein
MKYHHDAAAVLTLRHEGRDYGFLGISINPSDLRDDEARSLLIEVAGDLGLALHDIEAEQRRNMFAHMVANSQGAVALIDRRYVFLEANPAYLRFLNKDESAVVGHRVEEVLGEAFFNDSIRARIDRCFAGETVFSEVEREVPGVSARYIEAQYSPCISNDGTIETIVASVRDISKRKQAEAALRRHEALLSEMGRIATIGAWELDVASGSIDWTDEVVRIHELQQVGDVTLKRWLSCYDIEARARVERAIQETIEHKRPCELECEIESARGARKWIRIIARAVDEAGTVTKVVGSCQDVTQRKRTELALRESEERLRSLGDNLPVSYLYQYVRRADRPKFLYLSAGVERIHGMPAEEAIVDSSALFEQIGPEQYNALVQVEQLCLARMTDFETEISIQRRDGQHRWLLIRARPRALANGEIVWDGVATDITARKLADAQHQEVQEQLRVAQKLEAIGNLAGGVAHDFNNLLSVIMTYTGFALGAAANDQVLRDDLLEVQCASQRAADLTRQLLAFSRKQLLETVVFDLNTVVAGVRRMLERVLGEDVHLLMQLATEPVLIRADRGQIEQVLVNLVINARDAMPMGGTVTVATALAHATAAEPGPLDAAAGDCVRLVVTDTGCGMGEDTLARIFEPFFTTKEPGKGTGLGLSTVFGIVKQCGGCIGVSSQPEHGTSFEVSFPRAPDLTPTEVFAVQAPETLLGTETILLVEDEVALRNAMVRSLSEAGYRVLSAADGLEALEVSRRYFADIHLLLTDVVMPRMGGGDLARKLSSEHPNMAVIYLSGHADGTVLRHGVFSEDVHLLPKPITASSLLTKVREVADARGRTMGK